MVILISYVMLLLARHYTDSPYGFLNIEPMQWSPFLDGFITAGKELGYREIDANGPQEEGKALYLLMLLVSLTQLVLHAALF